jgi:hypothetical protein
MSGFNPLDPELLRLQNAVSGELISYTPEHFKEIVMEVRILGDGDEAEFKYRIDCPQHPDQGTNNPGQPLHEACASLVRWWRGKGATLPGFRMELKQSEDGNWGASFSPLEA